MTDGRARKLPRTAPSGTPLLRLHMPHVTAWAEAASLPWKILTGFDARPCLRMSELVEGVGTHGGRERRRDSEIRKLGRLEVGSWKKEQRLWDLARAARGLAAHDFAGGMAADGPGTTGGGPSTGFQLESPTQSRNSISAHPSPGDSRVCITRPVLARLAPPPA
jgi:hypothetical protein